MESERLNMTIVALLLSIIAIRKAQGFRFLALYFLRKRRYFLFFFYLQKKKIHYLHYLQCGLNTSLDNTTFYLQHSAYWLLTLLIIQDSTYNSIHTALNLTLTRLVTTTGCKHVTESRKVEKKEKRILSLGKRNVGFR